MPMPCLPYSSSGKNQKLGGCIGEKVEHSRVSMLCRHNQLLLEAHVLRLTMATCTEAQGLQNKQYASANRLTNNQLGCAKVMQQLDKE